MHKSLTVYCGPCKTSKSETLRDHAVHFYEDKDMKNNEVAYYSFEKDLNNEIRPIRDLYEGSLPVYGVNTFDHIMGHIPKENKILLLDNVHRVSDWKKFQLLAKDKHVYVAGRNINHIGIPYEIMGILMCLGDDVNRTRAECDYPGCSVNAIFQTKKETNTTAESVSLKMSDYVYQQWQDENAQRDYPLVENSEVPKDSILDAVFFVEAPVLLKKIGVSSLGNFLEITCMTPRGEIKFRNALSKDNRKYYTFTDLGKLVWGNMDFFSDKPPGFAIDYNDIPFLDSLHHPSRIFTLQGIGGPINVTRGEGSDVRTNISAGSIFVDLDETKDFEFEGISTINNLVITNGNLIIEGDKCTEITGTNGIIAGNDICLPPCFDCDARLTTGDVKVTIDQTEARIAALENP